jgi:hypothetical protein
MSASVLNWDEKLKKTAPFCENAEGAAAGDVVNEPD